MHSLRVIAVVLAALIGLVSCNRDPNVVKKRYFDSANKYFERGRYKEAIIQYKNALKRDGKYGPAHYKLALTAIKLNDVTGAVLSLRRAIELIPPNQPEHWDAVVKLSEIYLQFARSEKTYMDEVASFTRQLLDRDPNSFDAHRLIGDLNYAKAAEAFKNNKPEEGRKLLDTSAQEYKKADAIKPGQQGVSMQLARALFAKADFAGAEKLYRSVIEKDKVFPYSYSELYQLLMYQQRAAEGEQLLKQAFQNNPKEFEFLTALAMHYYGQRRRDDMLSVLQQIKSHSKDFAQAYFTVGDFYLRMGDGDSAIREYKEGMAKDVKRKSTYWKSIIEVLVRQGKRAEAADLNAQILKEDPNDNDARGLAATFLLEKGDVVKALAELTAVVTRAPDNPVARYNLGRAHAARGELEQARQQFDKAIELRADYVPARLALAQLQVTRGQFDAALKTAEAILLIDRGNVNARLIQSASLMGQKKYGESRNLLDAMLKANPSSPDVFFQLGVVNLTENKFKEAEDAFRRAYQVNPANSRGLMGIVETNMAQNRPEAALKLLQEESDRAPNRLDLLMAIGNTAVRAGKFDLAVQSFQKAGAGLEKGSKAMGDIYLRIGETYRRKGDANSAIQALQKAREILPDNVTVLGFLGLTLDVAGRKPDAKQVYEATLKLDPNNGVVLNNLAFLMAENNGDLDDALTKAVRAKQLLPNMFEVSDTIGWIYLKKNLSDNAIDILRDLVAKQPNHSTYRYHLGIALSQKGDKTKALEQLKEALKYNPSKEEKQQIQDLITRLG